MTNTNTVPSIGQYYKNCKEGNIVRIAPFPHVVLRYTDTVRNIKHYSSEKIDYDSLDEKNSIWVLDIETNQLSNWLIEHFLDTHEAIDFKIGDTSDGYHTFNELYKHRNLLYLAFLNYHGGWKSEKHHDETSFPDWFIAGCELEGMQITYHLPMKYWFLTNLKVVAHNKAPVPFDEHNSDDVAFRITLWLLKQCD